MTSSAAPHYQPWLGLSRRFYLQITYCGFDCNGRALHEPRA
jgi:hypothetical protein